MKGDELRRYLKSTKHTVVNTATPTPVFIQVLLSGKIPSWL